VQPPSRCRQGPGRVPSRSRGDPPAQGPWPGAARPVRRIPRQIPHNKAGGEMKKLHAVTAAVALCLASTLAVAQTKLKWAHVYEPTEPYHTAAVWAAGEIKKRTAGR